ncbi:MAG: phenylalanine--tRNA ligase subunit alpha [bacterium]
MTRLPEHEYCVVRALEPGESVALDELLRRIAGLASADAALVVQSLYRDDRKLKDAALADQAYVMAGAKALADRGLLTIAETPDEELSLVEDGGLEVEEFGLPERRALKRIVEHGGKVSFQELPQLLGKDDVRSEVKWLTKKGWCRRDAGTLEATEAGRQTLGSVAQDADELLLWELRDHNARMLTSEVTRADVKRALELLRGRDDILKRRKRTRRTLALTGLGAELKRGGIEPAQEVSQLTPELLVSGKWREVVFKPYDPKLETAPAWPGKEHPLQRVIQETRRAFLEMGFEEVASPAIETEFWDFDALFQPQDHPARELQDTFYIAEPAQGRLPAAAIVEPVRRTHEDGGDTGSTGWRYRWSAEKARKLVMRTHTTAATIRALAANPRPPRKVFSIGKCFRRDDLDQTHLPEFIQIDGIIIDEDANLATLFGTLGEFYRKMGAREVRFRPSFFPYTEPSAEVYANLPGLGWVEMCGSGVFRPEVTRPLGCEVPVIAWGGGLERVAMMRYGLDDIRRLYWSDVDWLKRSELCR